LWLSYLGPLAYLLLESFILFDIPIFWLWADLIKIVPESTLRT